MGKEKRQLLGSVGSLVVIAALLVIFCGSFSVAWFGGNNRVTAGGAEIEVQCSASNYDLASIGTNAGYYRDMLAALGVSEIGSDFQMDQQNGTSTESSASVYWNMTAESNLLNDNDGEIHKISPGATGCLTFYIIPHHSGELHVKLLLSLIGYQDNGEDIPTPTLDNPDADEQASAFLEKHLCFFTERTGTEPDFIFGGYLHNNCFEMDWNNVEAETPIQITLYWFWPGTLADLLGERVTEDAKTDLIDEITNDLGSFFRCANITIIQDIASSENLRVILQEEHKSDYNKLSTLYNQADQIIGISCDYLLLKLSTEEGD